MKLILRTRTSDVNFSYCFLDTITFPPNYHPSYPPFLQI